MTSATLRGAVLVLPDRVVRGGLSFAAGHITAILPGDDAPDSRDALDLDGDFLLPGLVDLHTDNLGPEPKQPRQMSDVRGAMV